ncbi:hypothetical protein [Paenibacillus sp. UASWS1643]|nr:hypothetical protein [Paenibacillus sp. UASWS1643]
MTSYSADEISWHEVPVTAHASVLSPEVNGGFACGCPGLRASGNGT